MQTTKERTHVADLIESADNIAIVCNAKGSDAVSAGIAFAHYIKQEMHKSPDLIYLGEFNDINSDLFDLYPISKDFQPKVLKVTLDYSGTNIEKVNYEKLENSKLVLEIKPVSRDFDMDRIDYNMEGIEYDLIITIGAQSLNQLKPIYAENKAEFDNAVIINIDNSDKNESYGKINIVDPSVDSISELMFKNFAAWNYTPKGKAAQSLLISFS